jgi:hypothetical protein
MIKDAEVEGCGIVADGLSEPNAGADSLVPAAGEGERSRCTYRNRFGVGRFRRRDFLGASAKRRPLSDMATNHPEAQVLNDRIGIEPAL